jgi:transcriptional regulator with XRE-family HTH domain
MEDLYNSTFDMVKTGKIISECRQKRNMTQLELAEKLNISYQAVSSWERGLTMPDISNLSKLAQVLEVTIDYILYNSTQVHIIDKINNGNISDIAKDPNVSFTDIVKIAPLLKPVQLNSLFKGADYYLSSIGALCGIAPFVSKDILDNMAINLKKNNLNESKPI